MHPHQLSDEAVYAHDCGLCVYLGRHASYDAYACSQAGWPTVILRYGNGGHEYHSGAHLIDRLPGAMQDRAQALMTEWRSA